MGLTEVSPVPSSPRGWEPGTSTHVSAAHNGGADGTANNGGIARQVSHALLSRGRLSDQAFGGYGG